MERAVAANHGHAGETYPRHVAGWTPNDAARWHTRHSEIRHGLLREGPSNVSDRVTGYVAAVQLAAEIACPLLGLPFEPEAAGAWLMLHLGQQHQDQNLAMLALRDLADYFVSNIDHFAGDGRAANGGTRLYGCSERHTHVGFLRSSVEVVFSKRRWNTTAVLHRLSQAGALRSTEKDRYTKKVSVGGVQHRLICIKWSALFPDDPKV